MEILGTLSSLRIYSCLLNSLHLSELPPSAPLRMINMNFDFLSLYVETLLDKQTTAVFWSPTGKNIVLSGMKNGILEFFNVDEFETMGQGEHFMTTDIIWDPTGRYVVTCVTAVQPGDNGYQIWSFQGRMLYR